MISFRVNQYRSFPVVSDLIFIWTKQKRNTLQELNRLAIIWLRIIIETHVRPGGVYLEEFEPTQILIPIDRLAVVWPLIREFSLTLLCS